MKLLRVYMMITYFYKNMSTENGRVPIFIFIFSLLLQCHCRTERLELSPSSSSGLACLDLKADLSAGSWWGGSSLNRQFISSERERLALLLKENERK